MAEYPLIGWKGGAQSFGDRKVVVTQHTGPASYTQITPGTPPAAPTGGDAIGATACGLKFIEAVFVCGDSSGTYSGVAFNPACSITGQLAGNGAAATSVPLQWTVAATGAQVAGATDLHLVQLTLIVVGF
jgi:hypothetical protein